MIGHKSDFTVGMDSLIWRHAIELSAWFAKGNYYESSNKHLELKGLSDLVIPFWSDVIRYVMDNYVDIDDWYSERHKVVPYYIKLAAQHSCLMNGISCADRMTKAVTYVLDHHDIIYYKN